MIHKESESGTLRTVLIILTLAASFVLWGFALFFYVGDKQSPPWDFGIIQDIPGESVHSTESFLLGETPEPVPQHVSQTPQAIEEKIKESEKK